MRTRDGSGRFIRPGQTLPEREKDREGRFIRKGQRLPPRTRDEIGKFLKTDFSQDLAPALEIAPEINPELKRKLSTWPVEVARRLARKYAIDWGTVLSWRKGTA